MHPTVSALLDYLKYGDSENKSNDESFKHDTVSLLARAYEKARNALEYRADHLVRRAAIERILKRQLVFGKTADLLAKGLLEELRWARYISPLELDMLSKDEVKNILSKYIPETTITDWVIKVISAEIEEQFNLNEDYKIFTNFAFQAIRQKINIEDEDIDLVLFVAVDRVYSQSDDAQIAYHILRLIDPEWSENTKNPERSLKIAREYFAKAFGHPLFNKITRFVRTQTPPLTLLRDLYFFSPSQFKEITFDEKHFKENAEVVLSGQLDQMSTRINRATQRSIIYLFLTKMLVALLIEAPLDIFLSGGIEYLALLVNLLFPPLTMWVMAQNINLPNDQTQKKLIEKSWQIISDFGSLEKDRDVFIISERKIGTLHIIFSTLYAAVFLGIFVLIFYLLRFLKFSIASQGVFVFFLTIVSFFAYRIRQTAQIYSWKAQEARSPFVDMILVPIVAAGSFLSREVGKLNFLVFVFDFILEAPFKTILRFLDAWTQFLSLKKEEVIG